MVDILKAIMGVGTFILGYFFIVLSVWTVPPLLDFLSDELAGILWFGLILMWIGAVIFLPVGVVIWALKQEGGISEGYFNTGIAILYSIFSLLFAYKSYFWLTTLTSAFTVTLSGTTTVYNLLLVIFWLGYIIQLAMNIIAIPAYIIIEAKNE